MTNEIKQRIAKIHELIQRGATPGERQAAQKALDRLIKKYNLDEIDLDEIHKQEYAFTYTSKMEEKLMIAIMEFFLSERYREIFDSAYKTTFDKESLKRCKQIRLKLEYMDWVTLDSAYEYFRRHMKAQWNKTCAPLVARCRKTKTRNERREQLQSVFLVEYLLASGLLDQKKVKYAPCKNRAEAKNVVAVSNVEGGKYHTQMQTAHMLPEPTTQPVKADKHGQINLF